MQYSLATLAAFVGAAMAQTWGFDTITAPVRDEVLNAGSSYDIKWTPDTTYDGKTVTIQLLAGTSNVTLQIADTAVGTGIASSAGSYTWAIPSTLTQENTYGFKLTLESDPSIFQYSNPFNIEFSASSSSSSSAVSSTSAAATSTSAAATTEVSTTSSAVETSASALTTSVASSSAVAPTSSVLYSNGTTTNTDLPEPTAAKTTLSTAKVSSGVASTTGSAVNSTSVQTAGAAGKIAPLALIAGAVALAL